MRLDPIVMVPYDVAWPASFERERRRLEGALEPALVRPIEHMGSTAVPGLAAKPIIDMLAVVGDIETTAGLLPAVLALGWQDAPEPADAAERRRSLCFPSVEHRTHHLHVVEEGFTPWCGWLAFRDHLRTHPDAAAAYAALKVDLAARVGGDPDARDGYRAGKTGFVTEVTRRALRPCGPT